MTPIHQLIANERKKAHLTEDEMAKKLKVTRATYQYWEKKTPSVEKIERVERALNLPHGYFFEQQRKGNDEKIIKPEAKSSSDGYMPKDTESKTILELAESNKLLAEATRVLSRNQENLIKMIKTTGDSGEGISAALKERFSNILELIALIGTGTRWNSREEAIEVLNKYAIAQD